MELSQSRPFETAQGRKATHDFLSLYTHSSIQQDSRPSQGAFLKIHNFLQPSEAEEKNSPNTDSSTAINLDKPPAAVQRPSVVEHVLPGGIGTYTISQIPYSNSMPLKSEENVFTVASVPGNTRNGENSSCSSYVGGGFILWDESLARNRNSGKESMGHMNVLKETTMREGQWPSDHLAQSSPNHRRSISPHSSSQTHAQKSQSFMEMINSAKRSNSTEEDEENVSIKRESSSSQKGELRVKVDGRSCDQKPNTPRSKHSATEQRRRCKINDRFQTLRGLIPHSDQKRDKASFLSEVIEYIQFLQEKVNRYEGSYPGWHSEPATLIPLRNHLGPSHSSADQIRVLKSSASPMLVFGANLDEKAAVASLNIQRNTQIRAEHNTTNTIHLKTSDQQPTMTNNTVPNSLPLQPDVYAPFRNNCGANKPSSRLPSAADCASLAKPQLYQNRMTTSEPVASPDNLKHQEPNLEGGTVSISSIYSQGLLNTLTQTLQSSGVDLSQASISVQVDVGKRSHTRQTVQDSFDKKVAQAPSCSQSSLHTISLEPDRVVKRLKTI